MSYDRLNEISIILRSGKTILSKVMYLILTVTGCILRNVDNRLQLYEYMDILSERNLEALKTDLENLLRFDPKFLDYLIMELVTAVIRKENKYRERAEKTNTCSFTDIRKKQWYKVIVRKKVRLIIKFVIFRKTERSVSLCNDDKEIGWDPYKEEINFILQNRIDHNSFLEMRESIVPVNERTENYESNCPKVNSDHEQPNDRRINDNKQSSNVSEKKFEPRDTQKYIYLAHSCKKIYCPLCYGWLWIPLYYCCMFLYPLAINGTCKFAHDIISH